MAGVKGRSGRGAHLEDKTIKAICRLSAVTIFKALRCEDSAIMSLEKKAEIAKHFVLRVMPQKIESDGSFAAKTIVLVRKDADNSSIIGNTPRNQTPALAG